jgi:hypothetical protein
MTTSLPIFLLQKNSTILFIEIKVIASSIMLHHDKNSNYARVISPFLTAFQKVYNKYLF